MLLEFKNLKALRIFTISIVVLVIWVWELIEHFVVPSTAGTFFFFIELGLTTLILSIILYFLFGALIRVFSNLEESHNNLLDLQAYQASILESSPYAIITFNQNDLISSFNREAESISGYVTKDIMGKDGSSLFKDKTRIQRACETARSHDHIVTIKETPLISKLGAEIPVSLLLRRINDRNDNGVDLVLIVEDLREKKRLERRLVISEKMSAMSQLAAGLAHEIRNPLASISINLRNLQGQFKRDEGTLKECENYFSMISSEIERLNRLVDNFVKSVSLKKIESSSFSCSLEEVLGAALETFQQLFENQAIQLIVKSPTNPVYIDCDRDQLVQAFSNIIQNAVEAMHASGTLTIETRQEGEWIQIKVRDTGCGIPRENLERILDFHFTTKSCGLGIGLPFASLFIEQHGGRIEIESEENKGTCIMIWLPIKRASFNEQRRELDG